MGTYSIIGGGIAGASIAYHLSKMKHNVTLYDRNDTGKATEASAGIICPWVSQKRNKLWYRLVEEGARYYPDFIKELEQQTGISTGYKRNGAICLFKNEHVQELAFQRISSKKETAPEMGIVKKMSPSEVRNAHPNLTTDLPAIFVEGGGQINGQNLLNALKEGILLHGGKWINEDVSIKACQGTVIYAAGAWGNEIAPQIPVRHQRAELLHFSLKNESNHTNTPVVMGLGPMYIVETSTHQYAIGTTHEDTESFSTTPSKENEAYLLEQAEQYFPNSTIQMEYLSVGLRPFTRESLPFIGYIDSNVFSVNGLGSSGLTTGPIIGKDVAAFLTGKHPTIPIDKFNF
ncbi:NAD(P)/FAD-dependent oxidoreductase [Gracilibacillus marinus]|uniref:NAD(P)/FAD-dependent oxidoreductase n=1 Tax=Gracilibacillus marinus TaxID=630535 RepID=A0ABV8VVZ6_9BACI